MEYVFIVYSADDMMCQNFLTDKSKCFKDFDDAKAYCDKLNDNGKYTSYRIKMFLLETIDTSVNPYKTYPYIKKG